MATITLRLRRPRFPEGDLVPWSGIAFVLVTGSTAAALGGVTVATLRPDTRLLLDFAVLAGLAALTTFFAVIGARHSVYDTAAVFLVAAAVLLPPGVAVFVAVPACFVDWRRRRASNVSLLHNTATAGLATLGASAVAHGGLQEVYEPARLATLGAVVAVYAGITCGLDGLFSYFARGDRLPAVSFSELGGEVVLASLGVALAALWRHDPWLIPFVLMPLAFVHRSQRLPALEEEAVTDSKTGLFNMKKFEEELGLAIARARAYERPLSLIVADLDLLREINNTHGHLAGDAVIHDVAGVLRDHLRRGDLAARFGGEEFLLAFPGIGPAEASRIAERIRAAVASRVFTGEAPRFAARATVSIGVASFPFDASTPRDLVHSADLAVLSAKSQGRNRVIEASSLAAA